MAFMAVSTNGQTFQTFKDTRVINTHSTEVLGKGRMDIRIGHRFGDMFGDRGGWETFYGLESARDVLFGAEYGLSDDITVGLSRSKGAGDLKQNVNSLLKWRFIEQDESKNLPVSAAFIGLVSVSTQKANEELTSVTAFPEFTHRMVFHSQFILARKFNPHLSLQIGGGFTHRNLVIEGGDNDILNFSAAGRVQVTKSFGLILDANLPISETITRDNGYYPALGIGFELETGGGHVFQINVTNSGGIMETDYIPYTHSQWKEGEFRLGFTISRQFKVR
jgi:hypothetical protein